MPEQTQQEWLEEQIRQWQFRLTHRPQIDPRTLAEVLASSWPSSPQGQFEREIARRYNDLVTAYREECVGAGLRYETLNQIAKQMVEALEAAQSLLPNVGSLPLKTKTRVGEVTNQVELALIAARKAGL